MNRERIWLESTCNYLQVVQQTYEEKYKMYDSTSTNENLIAMIQAQDRVLLDCKGYTPHDVKNLLTYEKPTLIEMVIKGEELLNLLTTIKM